MSDITVITPSLPERMAQREAAIASVARQTLPPYEHLVLVDYQRAGGSRALNRLADSVKTDWLAILPDDDAFLPEHLERLHQYAPDADVIYSPAVVHGPNPWLGYDEPFSPELLRTTSIVSHVALVRTDLAFQVGGWDAVQGYDWRFWVKCLDAGARFARHPERTWAYHLDEGNWHESRPWLAR